ncbi:MAG: OmpA family protein, partial [Spirochaetia bacterium]|nr:OmpA family protein [Spirochaetia bacterium]
MSLFHLKPAASAGAFAVLLGALLFAPSCATPGELAREKEQRRAAELKLSDLSRYQTEIEEEKRRLAAENQRLRDELGDKTRFVADASAERQKYLDKLAELEKRLSTIGTDSGASAGDVTVFQTPEGTVVEIKEGVLFDSGKKELKAKGREILEKLAAEIAATPYNIRIDGHTDSDPVKVHIKEFPLGNIELSVGRSLAVAGFFMRDSSTKIDEGRIA